MKEKTNKRVAEYWVAFVITAAMAVTSSADIYVDVNATGPTHDGTDWCKAYLYLQDALAAAGPGALIKVANGTYYPDEGTGQTAGDRQATFALVNNWTIEGGYAGCGAPDPDARDIAVNETILSGDLDPTDILYTDQTTCEAATGTWWNDVLCDIIGNNAINSLHVVSYNTEPATSPTLDGFTISGGNANGEQNVHDQGPAIYIRKASKCTSSGRPCFIDDDCRVGNTCEADACIDGGPTILNCTVKDNRSTNHGTINDHGSGSTFTNCTIRENFTENTGGGLQVHHGKTTCVTDCDFINNVAINQGGGVWTGDDHLNTPICDSDVASLTKGSRIC